MRLTPRGGKDAIDGIDVLADGTSIIKVRVRAAPEDNEANQALCALLAKVFSVPKRETELVQGHKSRLKTVLIRGSVEDLMQKARKSMLVLALFAIFMPQATRAEELDDLLKPIQCLDKKSYYETGVAVLRAQNNRAQAQQNYRTYRQALVLAGEGCKATDVFLLKRSVGMINALNRQLGLASMPLPAMLRE